MSKEREKYILEKLLKEKEITISQTAKELYVSESTLRRDFAKLEDRKLIKRNHGGAVLEETALSKNKIPFALRELEEASSKLLIAEKAAELVHNNDIVFLDASTSAYTLIPFLALKSNLTVVTNGVKALSKLAEYGINTISTGGRLIHDCLALVGEECYKTVEVINANVAFFSCRGFSNDGYLTDISAEENYVRVKMIKNSDKSYLLCTSDKIGKKYFHNLCHRNDITDIVFASEND